MENKNTNQETELTNEELNIFEEFSGELDFGEEKISLNSQEVKKDKLYYLKKSNTGFFVLNILLLFGVIFFGLFLFIQNSPTQENKNYLAPICDYLLPSGINNSNLATCSGVSAMLRELNSNKKNLEDEIFLKTKEIKQDLYSLENFVNTKEVSFLLNKRLNRIKPLEILNDFDMLKSTFVDSDKGSIVCDEITINQDYTVEAICYSYSSLWETNITGLKTNDKLQGTSISIASSFINFIKSNPVYNFQLLESQQEFAGENAIGESRYLLKTRFEMTLKYNSLNNTLLR